MKLIPFVSAAIGATVSAACLPADHPPVPWQTAGPSDVRGPCPMLNTLANHGYLPHDGKNISLQRTIDALGTALNIDKELAQFLYEEAMTTNPDANATTFSLSDLNRHNILEHDASLSRQDYYFGNDHVFNQTIFDETRSYWTEAFIDVSAAALARQARVNTSNATNPTFTLSTTGLEFGYGESAAYIIVLGNKTTGLVDKSWVEYLFENERLPSELGWKKAQEAISTSDLDEMSQRIVNATGGSTGQQAMMLSRRGVHAGGLQLARARL
ncbi:hypothetical protein BDW71DRAFT_214194 [Aspergillus fruticulosus]